MDFSLSEEQQMWRKIIHDFVTKEIKPTASHVNEQKELHWHAIRKMVNVGLLTLNVPEEFGGAGVDAISAAIAIEELGWGDAGTALTIAAHNGLGCEPINRFGTNKQKEVYLEPFSRSGEKLASLALTEPDAGSDLQAIKTKAILDGDDYIVNGSKAWITNALDSAYIITLINLSQVPEDPRFSLLIILTNATGVQIAPQEKKMGLGSSSSSAILFNNVRVPKENLLGAAGDGLKQTLTVLDGGRISIGAISVGIAQAAMEEAIKYAKERKTFGKPLADQQAIQWMLADAATEIHAARLMVYYAAWLKDLGKRYTKEAAMAKLFASEMAEKVTRNAIQIHGGYGYSTEYPVERYYRDTRLMTIGEGTSEIQRLVIARMVLGDMGKHNFQ